MAIAVTIGRTTRNCTSEGTTSSAAVSDSSYEPVSMSSPMPSTTSSTGTTTAAEAAMNSKRWRK
jgi:hypothetical protein